MRGPSEKLPIPVLCCIDEEPDEREVDLDVRADWVGFEHALVLVEQLRPAMEAATGRRVRLSWFLRMDPTRID